MMKTSKIKFLIILIIISQWNPFPKVKGDIFQQYGCDTFPISWSAEIINGDQIIPCYGNCQSQNLSKKAQLQYTMLVPVKPGATFCLLNNNQTEYDGNSSANVQLQNLVRFGFGPQQAIYLLEQSFVGAINIKPTWNCLCHCPDGVTSLNCKPGFDFCDDNAFCVNMFQDGIFSDCFENNLGPFSTGSQECCAFDFSTHEHATFYKVSQKFVVQALYYFQTFKIFPNGTDCIYTFWPPANGGGTIFSTDPHYFPCGACYVDNHAPVTYQTINLFPPAINDCSIFGVCCPANYDPNNICSCQGISNVIPLGAFQGNFFPGDIWIAIYQNKTYFVPEVNDISLYEIDKCGWLKFASNGREQFDRIAVTSNFLANVSSCVHDDILVTTSINYCNTKDWILLDTYLAQWGNVTVDVNTGNMVMQVNQAPNALFEFVTNTSMDIVAKTYSVKTFNCTVTSTFQSGTLTCNLNYVVGATHITYTLYDPNNNGVAAGDIALTGTGQDTVTFTVPAASLKVNYSICFPGPSNAPRCQNITIQGNTFMVTNPNWVTNTQLSNTTNGYPTGGSPNFNFFDWTTWGSNWWKTLVSWFLVLVIGILIIGAIIAAFYIGFYIITILEARKGSANYMRLLNRTNKSPASETTSNL